LMYTGLFDPKPTENGETGERRPNRLDAFGSDRSIHDYLDRSSHREYVNKHY
jgi:hypothetical protein